MDLRSIYGQSMVSLDPSHPRLASGFLLLLLPNEEASSSMSSFPPILLTSPSFKYRGQIETYRKIQGIKIEHTVSTTLELNGLVERINLTIMEKGKN